MTQATKQVANTRLHVGPGSLVLWFLLYPLNLGISVSFKRRLKVSEGEWSELLQPYDCNVINASLLPLICEVVVDLTTAKKNLFNLIVGHHFS